MMEMNEWKCKGRTGEEREVKGREFSGTRLKPLTGEVNNIDHFMLEKLGAGVHPDMYHPPLQHCRGPSEQEWLEEHDKELKVVIWPPNSPDLNLIDYLRNAPQEARSREAHPHNKQAPTDPPHWCIGGVSFTSCETSSRLMKLHKS